MWFGTFFEAIGFFFINSFLVLLIKPGSLISDTCCCYTGWSVTHLGKFWPQSISINRSSHQRCFLIKGVPRTIVKFTGKHLCQSLFFNKVAGLRPTTIFKTKLWHRCFPVNFAIVLRTVFIIEHLWWLLLNKNRWINLWIMMNISG